MGGDLGTPQAGKSEAVAPCGGTITQIKLQSKASTPLRLLTGDEISNEGTAKIANRIDTVHLPRIW